MTFTVEDEGQDIPHWQEIPPEGEARSHGNAAYTFTSALPPWRNLADFAVDYR